MSLLALGGTVALGGTITAGTVAAGASLAATAYGAMSAGKSAKAGAAAIQGAAGQSQLDPRVLAEILSSVEEYKPVNVQAVAQETAANNAGQGVNLAQRSATKLNKTAVDDVVAAMNRMFGGKDTYEAQRDKALSDINDHLNGRVSSSTRTQISRGLLGSAITDLGDGATGDAFTGYLGTTTEALTSQGGEELKSLYSTWRQAIPLINGAQILDKFTISPDNAVQSEIQNAQNVYQSSMGIAGLKLQAAGMGYQANYNNAMMAADAARMRANGNQQVAGAIASGIGTIAGTYASGSAGYDAGGKNNYGGDGHKTQFGGYGGSVQMINNQAVQAYKPVSLK